jgi:hypothetical protein
MPKKTKTEPDIVGCLGDEAVTNLDICPICDGEGLTDQLLSTDARKAPIIVEADCPCCGGDGLAFPSEIRAYQAQVPVYATAA